MFIYIFLLTYLTILFYIYDIRKERRYKALNYVFSCILLILVAGLRYRIGLDTNAYMRSFESPYYPKLQDFSLTGEYGSDIMWVFINSLAKTIGGGFYTVQFIQAATVNIAVFWFIRKHSPKPFMGILLFFMFQWWNYCFEAMRESIAIAFYLFALDALISEKSLKKYYLRVWPAALVHTFGFVTFLFPLIQYIKINRYLPIVIILFLGVFLSIGDILNELVESMAGLENAATAKATKYIESDTYGTSNLSLAGIAALVISRIIPMAFLIYVLHRNRKAETDIFIPYLICYILVVLLRIKIPIFFRFYNYFEIMMVIAMTQAVSIPSATPGGLKRIASWAMIALMIFLRTYELTKPEVDPTKGYKTYNRYIPYNSVFTEDYNEETEYIFRALQ